MKAKLLAYIVMVLLSRRKRLLPKNQLVIHLDEEAVKVL